MKLIALLASTTLLVSACANTHTTSPATRTVRAEAPQPSAEVREAQNKLHTLGLYDGGADGLWGPETQAAVERFQRNQNLPVTTRLDGPTLSALRSADTAPVSVTDQTDVRTMQNRLRQLNFYNGPADGVWGPGMQVALENFQRAHGLPVGQVTRATIVAMGLDASAFPTRNANIGSAPPARTTVAGNTLDRGVVRGIQQRLRRNGFYSGAVDGVWGPRTQASLIRFQRSRGIESTGELNPTTISALGLDPNNLAASTAPGR
jgi:peptidoglycan hydrolase-like protein with peptidoglycan-binding domain